MVTSSATRQGLRDALSVVVGYIPFSIALGAALGAAGVKPLTAWLTSPLVFAGTAQLVSVQMLGAGAGGLVVVATALVINSRHLLYSASMIPHTRTWRRRDRWAAAYFLADPVFAVADARYRSSGWSDARAGRHYYFALAATCWTAWLLLTGTGVLLAGSLPPGLRLEVAAPLTFLLLLLPTMDSTPSRVAALVGGTAAVVASGLPLGTGLLLGAAVGIAAGRLAASAQHPVASDPATGEQGEEAARA
ncbi:AzlC family ABC transporter permease [Actinotalea sp. K2]|uniref:AzlC family ABC transporter permease n=1 Tax=Actinotalea sp. K2 TaxID=2939438 RepID=UPI002016F5A9|nr:AzlC family ABC transporter permease [Actinotalea sp. K2]MCL3861071.1 AzlC family ABC transporter permease [Actinotalea sp. K2]